MAGLHNAADTFMLKKFPTTVTTQAGRMARGMEMPAPRPLGVSATASVIPVGQGSPGGVLPGLAGGILPGLAGEGGSNNTTKILIAAGIVGSLFLLFKKA